MSMIGNFLLVSDAEIAALLAAPETVHTLLDERVYDVEEAVDYVDVDKAWHALHFLLTGTAWEGSPPLDFIASGGEPIGDEDVGYGPARALRAADVAALDRALEPIPPEALIERYDGAAMDALEIYPGGWSEFDPRRGDEFGYYAGAYEELRLLVHEASARGRGLLIWIS